VLLCGTGEANTSGDSYDGIGMLKTTDGGDTWSVVGLENSQRIARIAWDATNPDVIHAAVAGGLFSAGPDRGMYRSTDAGATWAQTLFVSDTTSATDVVVDPTDGNKVYCAMWHRLRGPGFRTVSGTDSRIWRSTDAGVTWVQTTTGLPTGSDVARMGLAVAPSSPNIVYAVVSRFTTSSGTFLDDVYRSTNSGATWNATNNSGLGNPYSSFGWYFGQIRVSPVDSGVLFVPGVSLERSTNGGSSWSEVTGSAHVDFHDVFIDPANPSRVLSGSDGGVFRSTNGGSSWSKCPDLPISQFYAVTVDPQLPQRIYGGTQDNSTLRTLTGALDDWDTLIGGDGFTAAVDPTNSNVIYGEAQYGWLTKSTDGWNFSTLEYFGGFERTNWHMPFLLDPNDPQTIYAGSYRVYRSTDGGSNFNTISGDLTNGDGGTTLQLGTLTTIAVSPSAPGTIYTGADDGSVFRTTNGGGNWARIDGGLPVRYITRVTVDPGDDAVAYVALSGLTIDDYLPHLFRTTNHGSTWTDITGNLPVTPVNDVIVDPQDHNRLFAGTDVGVFVSNDLGGMWTTLGTGLPLSVVVDIELHDASRTLVAGTHGRSAFTLDLGQAVDAPEVAALRDGGLRLMPPSPNPVRDRTSISYTLPTAATARLALFDVNGRRVRTLVDRPLAAGSHSAEWDGRDDAGNSVAAGAYFARLTAGAEMRTTKVLRVR
ncbi:T9SS type A sorting domain-containing protein, partial [bacterium]|nr:T9SS type A sorting domain-containing protein [bacterium]